MIIMSFAPKPSSAETAPKGAVFFADGLLCTVRPLYRLSAAVGFGRSPDFTAPSNTVTAASQIVGHLSGDRLSE